MTYPWFKFYGSEYLSDPKILALTACQRSCWITLLAYASNSNGVIKFVDEETLMVQAGVNFQEEEWDRTRGVLEKFVKLEMITIDNEVITIINWHKRQETSQTGYERVKKWREKRRNDNVNDNKMITVDKNRIDKNRIDKKEKVAFTPPTLQEVTDYCNERKNGVDPDKWHNFYTAKGWMVGKNKMKDWRAAVRTWEKDTKPDDNETRKQAERKEYEEKFYQEHGYYPMR